MIVELSADGQVRLAEPNDFRNFKLLVKGSREKEVPKAVGITFVDDRNVLIEISLVPTLPGCPNDKNWCAGYSAMIEAAQKYGWIDAQAQAIRAHVEQVP